RLEQSADGPEGLLARHPSRATEPERIAQPLDDQLSLLLPGEPHRDRRYGLLGGIPPLGARNLPDDLGPWPVGGALPAGQAAAAQARHVVSEPACELPHQSRLTHARTAEHSQQMAGPVADHLAKRGLERGALPHAPDEGGVEAAAHTTGRARDDIYEDQGM